MDINLSKKIEKLTEMDCFKEHPENLLYILVKDDPLKNPPRFSSYIISREFGRILLINTPHRHLTKFGFNPTAIRLRDT